MSVPNPVQNYQRLPLRGFLGAILLMGISLTVGLWLFVVAEIRSDYHDAIDIANRETMNLAIGFEEHVRRIISDADKNLIKLRKAYEREGVTGQSVNDLLEIGGSDPSVVQFAIDNDKGITVAAFDKRAIGNDISKREYFQFHQSVSADILGIGKPISGKASGEFGIPVTRRLYTADGSFDGIMIVALRARYFLEFYQKIDLGTDQLVGLYGLDGIVRARQSNNNQSFGQDITSFTGWGYIQKGPLGTNITSGTDGIQRIMSYRIMPEYPLFIVVGKSLQKALSGYEQRKRNYILGAALINLIFLAFCFEIISRHNKLKRQNERLKATEEELLAHNEELQAKEEELSAQNEELQAKEEELLAQNEELQAQEEELLAQNEELRVKEEELFTSKERYRALLTQMSEGIIICEYPAMDIVEANSNAIKMFGYSEPELLSMNMSGLRAAGQDKMGSTIRNLLETKSVVPKIHSFRHKDGHTIYTELAGSLIEHQGQVLCILSCRDITEERKFKEQIRRDVEMAGLVQKAMLPGDYEDEKVTIKTIYEPIRLISGDYYGYKWVRGGSLLNGYLLDVTGHGMATALQTAAVSALLEETIEKDRLCSKNAIELLNSQLAAYLPDSSYAAVLLFSFDFEKRILTCIAAGINYLIAFCRTHHGWVTLRGSFLGSAELGRFESIRIPFQYGDTFCFVTDGLFEGLTPQKFLPRSDFNGIIEEMSTRVARADRTDDCTMLCLQVKAAPVCPVLFEYSNRAEREHVLARVRKLLEIFAGKRDFYLEVSLGEAETNAFRHGTNVRIKLNQIGQRLIIRVYSDGNGFNGNEALKKIEATGIKETFEASLSNEHGRGIPLMLAMMDKVLYNRSGTEVMMVKALPEKGRGMVN